MRPVRSIALSLILILTVATVGAAQSEGGLTITFHRDFGYSAGGEIQGAFSLTAEGPDNLARVDYYLDSQLLGSASQAPFKISFNTGNPFSANSSSFSYGKQNQFYIRRGGLGVKRYYSEKAKRKGLAVGVNYEFGASLGIVKPYYLDLLRVDDNEVRYYATSLPIAHTLRRRGRRRWGVECLFRDCKSSGWNIEASEVQTAQRHDSLLTLLSVNYLWMTCLGRWLCKTGRRSDVDAQSDRHLSLFRIGWDWVIHQTVLGQPCPPILTLYA